jgi:glutamate synthase (NADPH/NADH) small chain
MIVMEVIMPQAVPSETLEIDRRARAIKQCEKVELRPPDERVQDFEDVVIPLGVECIQLQASRCIHCPDPAACVVACPVDNDIPSAMWLIEKGQFLEAAALYRQTSSLPEICGRVCPHEQVCEGSCVLTKENELPVLCGALEVYVMDYERMYGEPAIPIGEPTEKKVAIIGAGPAGLSCADILTQKGYAATIFEAKPAGGGLLTYGIPNFKLPKDVVFNRLEDFEKAGVEFVFNTYIGKDKTIDDLFEEGFDAVFIGVGTGVDARMEIPGEDLQGVYEATDFLIRANVHENHLPDGVESKPDLGRKVVIVGGGDTASDALRSALRLGAEEVTCIYRRTEKEMPGSYKDRELAREEGAIYNFLTQPVRFIPNDSGRVGAVECIQMELGEPDQSGRRRPVPIEGSEFIIEADTVVKGIGYWPDPTIGKTTGDLETHQWGLIIADPETGETSRPGVYAGGDAVTGPDLVVTACAAGRKSALAIDKYLNKET